MVLHYDENKTLVCNNVKITTEDILTCINILIEKNKTLENYDNGLKLKIDGIMYIDFIDEELIFSF